MNTMCKHKQHPYSNYNFIQLFIYLITVIELKVARDFKFKCFNYNLKLKI